MTGALDDFRTHTVGDELVAAGMTKGDVVCVPAFSAQANEVERSCEPLSDLTREHELMPVPMEYFSVTRPPAAGRVVELTLIDAELAASATAGMATVASVIDSIVAMDALRNETNFMSTLESFLV